MALYSVYSISASIVQGIGNPKIPMYILITGCVVIFILGWHLIPKYGIVGGALATTLSSFMMTVLMFLIQFRLTKTKPPYQFMLKVLISSFIMTLPSFILPRNNMGLLMALVICPLIYIVSVVFLKAFAHEDIIGFKKYSTYLGPFKEIFNYLLDIVDKLIY